MKNTKNLERKSSADRITCFLPLYYYPLAMATNNTPEETAPVDDNDEVIIDVNCSH